MQQFLKVEKNYNFLMKIFDIVNLVINVKLYFLEGRTGIKKCFDFCTSKVT